jgi:TrmH family RNA methyltransferase
MDELRNVRVVLDRTSHPGNIGAAARAMKVMGLADLRLVRPERFPHAEATALASNADDVLDAAGVHESLDEALAGCTLVVGTSARRRSVSQEILDPAAAAERLLAARGPVALVFGCEKSGLDNDGLDRCHALVRVPTSSSYASLNLAQAVQVICYELHRAARAGTPPGDAVDDHEPAAHERMEVFFERLERTLSAIRFSTPGQDRTLHRRLRRLFLRARPDDDELNMLNGILSRTLHLAEARRGESEPEDD